VNKIFLCVSGLRFPQAVTKTLISTLREAPANAEIRSHQLPLRAGLILKLAGGVYTLLSFGRRGLECRGGAQGISVR